VAITDTGPRIPEDELSRIFERFYRLDKSRPQGGAGLGLAIVREIVEAHRGQVTAGSQIGMGSRFVVRLPPAPGAASTPPARPGVEG